MSFIGVLFLLAAPVSGAPHATADSSLLSFPMQLNLLQIGNINPLPLRQLPVHNVYDVGWDDSAVVIHHSVIELPQDWGGGIYRPYKHAMAYTPYRSPLDENPHIAFSNDGINWSEELISMDGSRRDTISNPIWSPAVLETLPDWQNVGIVHLSDPDLILDDNQTLWVIFRVKIPDSTVNAKYQIVVTKSDDFGLNWTEPKIIIDTDRGDPVKGGMWSPAIWRDTADIYHMLGVYTNAYGPYQLDTVNRIALWSCEGPDPDANWDEDTILYDFLPSDTATRDWWHPEILTRGANELIMLMTTTEARQQGAGARLFLATSSDGGLSWDSLGQVFDGTEFPWTNIPFAYRAGAVHRLTSSGEAIDVWLAAKDTSVQSGESSRTGMFTMYFETPCPEPGGCNSCCAIPGNADGSVPDEQYSSAVNIADVTYLLQFIFVAGPAPPCYEEGDVDGGGSVNIGDVTYLISYIFAGGAAPACPTQ